MTKLALDDPKRVFDLGPNARLDLIARHLDQRCGLRRHPGFCCRSSTPRRPMAGVRVGARNWPRCAVVF